MRRSVKQAAFNCHTHTLTHTAIELLYMATAGHIDVARLSALPHSPLPNTIPFPFNLPAFKMNANASLLTPSQSESHLSPPLRSPLCNWTRYSQLNQIIITSTSPSPTLPFSCCSTLDTICAIFKLAFCCCHVLFWG